MSSPLLKTLVVPAASGTATASVIFAHGLGDSGLGWLDVAKMLAHRPLLPHVRFVLPNAPVQPVTLNMGMSMPAWFDITTLEDMGDAEDEKGLLKSSGEIKRLIQAEIDGSAQGLGGKGIQPARIVVGGFSQVSSQAGHTVTPTASTTATAKPVDVAVATTGQPAVSCYAIKSTLSDAADILVRGLARAGASAKRKENRVLGVGVDVMHRPRLASLLQRHGQRSRSNGNPADPAATMRQFARRILCQAEAEELATLSTSSATPQSLLENWLAVRWTAKEAAYKALYPCLRLRWSDLMGGAIAYLAGLTHPAPLAGIIGLSTWLPLKSKILSLSTPHANATPVFHGHGSSDQIVQFEFGKRTVEFLQTSEGGGGGLGMGEYNASGGEGGKPKGVKFEVYRGMQHSACPEEIEHVGQFLEAVVPKL